RGRVCSIAKYRREETKMVRKSIPIRYGLTFDDVLLVPKRTAVRSRSLVDLKTRVSRGIAVKLPFVSANTPWCTGAAMATALARLGGIGVVHRMCTAED